MGNLDFDCDSVEPTQSFEPIPHGTYKMQIVSSEVAPNSKGSGKILKLTLEVLEAPYTGRKVFENLNFLNDSEKAQAIAQGLLSAICKACGKSGIISNSEELHEIPFIGKLKVKPAEGTYGPKNQLTDAIKISGAKKAEKLVAAATTDDDSLPF